MLDLPVQKQQDDLAAILGRTQLAAIINAAKTVVDRLDFVGSLDSLLFGDLKKTLLERKQLHRILAEELRIFGEQYTLGHRRTISCQRVEEAHPYFGTRRSCSRQHDRGD